MTDYTHVLLAVDFSPGLDAVAAKAGWLSRLFNARLSLVHVVEVVPVDLSNEMALPQAPQLEEELVEAAQRRLADTAARLGADSSDCFVLRGSTRREILRFAEERDVDLIVVGSHGRQGIQLLLGSTANGVLHGAPCDVLAVRVKD